VTAPGLDDPQSDPSNRLPWLAIVRLLGLVLVVAALGLAASARGARSVGEAAEELAASGAVGILGFVVVYAVATVLLVPATPLTIVAGAVYGTLLGSLVAGTGATVGALAAYLVARATGRGAVEVLLRGRALDLDAWVARRPFRTMLTLRLVPLVPFNVLNYAAGLSSIGPSPYTAATALGIVPGVVLLAAVGGTADRPGSPGFVLAVSGFAALVVVGGWWARRQRRIGVQPASGTTRG
jgi:uncharacterized membrane protein YdjX (TVP38/TMEM64 family)